MYMLYIYIYICAVAHLLLLVDHVGADHLAGDGGTAPGGAEDVAEAARADLLEQVHLAPVDVQVARLGEYRGGVHIYESKYAFMNRSLYLYTYVCI